MSCGHDGCTCGPDQLAPGGELPMADDIASRHADHGSDGCGGRGDHGDGGCCGGHAG